MSPVRAQSTLGTCLLSRALLSCNPLVTLCRLTGFPELTAPGSLCSPRESLWGRPLLQLFLGGPGSSGRSSRAPPDQTTVCSNLKPWHLSQGSSRHK